MGSLVWLNSKTVHADPVCLVEIDDIRVHPIVLEGRTGDGSSPIESLTLDAVVVDSAHNMSAIVSSGEVCQR